MSAASLKSNICLQLLLCSFVAFLYIDSVGQELFDEELVPFADANELIPWAETLTRMQIQQATINECLQNEAICKGRLRSVRLLINKGQDLERHRQVQLVNRFINRFSRYRSDRGDSRRNIKIGDESVKVRQDWSTLLEFLKRGGDCEDYATAKYQLLRLMGVPADELKIVVIFDRDRYAHHALVAVANVKGRMILLDTNNETYRRRLPLDRYVYALNETHIWNFGVEETRLKWSVRRALRKQGVSDRTLN